MLLHCGLSWKNGKIVIFSSVPFKVLIETRGQAVSVHLFVLSLFSLVFYQKRRSNGIFAAVYYQFRCSAVLILLHLCWLKLIRRGKSS